MTEFRVRLRKRLTLRVLVAGAACCVAAVVVWRAGRRVALLRATRG